MRLSEANKEKLESKGIFVFDRPEIYFIVKKIGAGGNCLPGGKTVTTVVDPITGNETRSESPLLSIVPEETKFRLGCHSWVPGPGPGDFEKEFTNENEMIEYILSYFFENNEYFEARRRYEEDVLKKG